MCLEISVMVVFTTAVLTGSLVFAFTCPSLQEFLELTSDRADPSWLQNSCAGSSSR
jgi:hypothetical protein